GFLVQQMLEAMSEEFESSVFISPEQKRAMIKSIFTNYYQSHSEREIIFDTSRRWCCKLSIIEGLFPSAKVICCVRNIAWIMDSIERLTRNNAFDISRLFFSSAERNTVYSRTEALSQSDRLVGFAYNAFKEAFYSEDSDKLLIVDYEVLTENPAETMKIIYQFIGEEYFEHDFNNVQYEEPEFDRRLNTKGLHKVRSKVEYQPRDTILPPDLFEQFSRWSFWTEAGKSKATIIATKPKETSLLKILDANTSS
ncbi:MAG: sulfotransferase, partial [Actinomycetota bacterium]